MITTTAYKTQTETPQIYVADLAAYNNGMLHGKWIDATQSAEEIEEEVREMLKNSPVGDEAEEWAIHDDEYFEPIKIHEWDSFEHVSEIANAIVEHGEMFGEIYNHLGSGTTVENAIDFIEDNYAGEYDSLGDFAEELNYETQELPKDIYSYIDFESMGRDMELSGYILSFTDSRRKLHVFWNR